ncbi:MAG: hypothetical protein H5U36_06720 [Candidatus Caldatribacterium sp.]|nr:hypothetical protein [Candidatus Caldatribacterium sp.]
MPILHFDLLRNREAIEYYAGEKLRKGNELMVVTRACQKVLDATRTIRVPVNTPTYKEEDGFLRLYTGWTSWVVKRPFHDYPSFLEWVKQSVRQSIDWHPSETFLRELHDKHVLEQELLGDTLLFWTAAEGWFYGAYEEAGFENFSFLWYDDPLLFSEWLEGRFLRCKTIVELLADPNICPVAFLGEDIASNKGLIFSPRLLESEFFPRLKVLVDVFHKKGIKVVFHSDGNFLEVLDQIIDTGIDGLNPLDPLAGLELEKMRTTCPSRVVLIGNLDCSHLLPFGPKKKIREEVKRICELAKSAGGVIFASSSELHDGIPLENLICMFDAFWEYRW